MFSLVYYHLRSPLIVHRPDEEVCPKKKKAVKVKKAVQGGSKVKEAVQGGSEVKEAVQGGSKVKKVTQGKGKGARKVKNTPVL